MLLNCLPGVSLLRALVLPEGAYVSRRLLPLAADAVDDEAVTNDCREYFRFGANPNSNHVQ